MRLPGFPARSRGDIGRPLTPIHDEMAHPGSAAFVPSWVPRGVPTAGRLPALQIGKKDRWIGWIAAAASGRDQVRAEPGAPRRTIA